MYSQFSGQTITAVLKPGNNYEPLYRHPNTVVRELVVVDGEVRTKPVAVKNSTSARTSK